MLLFKKLDPRAIIPKRQTEVSAAYDLHALERTVIPRDGCVTVRTGIAMSWDKVAMYSGSCALVLPRSGLGTKHGITLANSVGLIDADYQGEILCFMVYRPHMNSTVADEFVIEAEARFAQLLPVGIKAVMDAIEVREFPYSTERGSKGFGSTGG